MSTVALALRGRTFRSLRRHHNYRLFFAGQIVSLAGSWMQNVALAWLVLSLSRSPLAVATLLFCRFAPYTLFGLFAGSIVDRLDTRRLVVWTQVAAMIVQASAVTKAERGGGESGVFERPFILVIICSPGGAKRSPGPDSGQRRRINGARLYFRQRK